MTNQSRPDRDSIDRYRNVGFTRNPFTVQLHDADADTIDHSWFVDRGLANPPDAGSRTMVQVIGDKGVGKSTHLHHWRILQPGPYHYIPRTPYRLRWRRPPLGPLVYGDEIDRMPPAIRWSWLRDLSRLGSTVVVGSHRDLGAGARRAGFAVQTHHLRPVDGAELRAVLDKRLQMVTGIGSESPFQFSDGQIEQILQLSGGNLRAVDGICHQIVAAWVADPANQRAVAHRPSEK